MATSGTTVFSVSRDSIINAALRGLHVYGPTDSIPPADITYCAEALNIMVKAWAIKGMLVWTVGQVAVPMVANQATYLIGPTATGIGSVVTNLPMRVFSAFMRDSTGNDVDIKVESRFDYNLLGQKASTGRPNQMFYDKSFPNGTVTLYNVPIDNTYTLFLTTQRQIQDFNLSTDNPDFPQEFYQALKWGLMDEIALEYEATAMTMKIVAMKAAKYVDDLVSYEQEDASVQFTPSSRSY